MRAVGEGGGVRAVNDSDGREQLVRTVGDGDK